jgi:ADP-dependent NAD(P)H-hydrate dehydratase / NAD(P)H-hydrate epimerase
MLEVVLSAGHIRDLLPPRRKNVHKGSVGKVLVIAGSRGMTGAAQLASRAVLRSGAGTVTLALPAALVDAVDAQNIEVMTFPLPQTEKASISADAFGYLKILLRNTDAVLIGPGLSTHPGTITLVEKVLQYISRYCPQLKTVLDADGLRALPRIIRGCRMPLILTPHPGELARLLGKTNRDILARPVYYAQYAARKYCCVVVLKGHRTYTCDRNKTRYFLTANGNPGMATAGSGDVLAGIIAGLWVTHKLPANAVGAVGPYVHAVAGNIAANKKSIDGIIASDILAEIPSALRLIKGR